jgi:hypothetical protein
MPCEEGCRTAVLGKTERMVGWEGNGKLTMIGLVRHCKRGNPQKWIGPIYRGVSHSFTLDVQGTLIHELRDAAKEASIGS